MKKYINIVIVIIIVLLFTKMGNTDRKVKIDIEKDTYYIKFIYNKYVDAVNVVSDKKNNLYLLNYSNMLYNNIDKYDLDGIKNIYNLNNENILINSVKSHKLKIKNNLIKIKLNNKKLCIYKYIEGKTNFEDCNFIYLYDKNNFVLPKNYKKIDLIIQKENNEINNKEQEIIYDDWIDMQTLNYEEFIILKIKDNDYDILDIDM